MMLENKKELKEYTWKEIMFSAMFEPARHASLVMRALVGSLGFHASPTKTARVKRELTLMRPSKAVMWMLVVIETAAYGDQRRI